MIWGDIPAGTICSNCGEHPATENWYGDSSAMGWIHSSPQWWCQCCALKAQIDYCLEMEARIPVLRAELEAACA